MGTSGGTENSENQNSNASDIYKIQYTMDNVVKNVEVESGDLYVLEVPTAKFGYDFVGYFDAEVGGTKYAGASGSSLAAFSDNDSIVLYPQFLPKEYSVYLDYQGAEASSDFQMQVNYNEYLGDLPQNLTLDNKEFVGWFSKPNGEGTKISNTEGNLSASAVLNKKNFELSDDTTSITLYAGFEKVKHSVTFYGDGNEFVKKEIEHGTKIDEVVVELEKDGKNVLSWSKTKGGEVFTGEILCDEYFYAVEWATFLSLTFNSNGGTYVKPVIAQAGKSIQLPLPSKSGYEFVGWYMSGNQEYTSTIMPSANIELTAKWEAIAEGTQLYPYIIKSKEDFVNMVNNSNAYFVLANDINLGNWNDYGIVTWGANKDLCNDVFSGNLDGKNFTVSFDLDITHTDKKSWAFGLFPATRSANISNLNVKANIQTRDPLNRGKKWDIPNADCAEDVFVGGLIGYAKSTTVINCNVSGNIKFNSEGGAGDTCVGGVIGYSKQSYMQNLSSNTVLYSRGFTINLGGCIGLEYGSTVANLYFNGNCSHTNDWMFGKVYVSNSIGREDVNTLNI